MVTNTILSRSTIYARQQHRLARLYNHGNSQQKNQASTTAAATRPSIPEGGGSIFSRSSIYSRHQQRLDKLSEKSAAVSKRDHSTVAVPTAEEVGVGQGVQSLDVYAKQSTIAARNARRLQKLRAKN